MLIKWLIALVALALLALGGNAVLKARQTDGPKRTLIEVGQPAPDFSAVASPDGQTVHLAGLRGQAVILVFYPMDNTPGCTIQLCSLRDQWPRLQDLKATVLGINPAGLASHQQFAKGQHYPFPLVVDADRRIAKAFGVGDLMSVNTRTVIIVGPDGVVRYAKEGMPSVAELLAVVEGLHPSPAP